MCGRFTLTCDEEVLREAFELDGAPEDYRPRYNIAPAQPVLALADGMDAGAPRTGTLLWGLVPRWTLGKAPAQRIINVRAETLGRRFRHHFERRRCVIPADGFFEWQREGGARLPLYITRPHRQPFGLAAIWDRWSAEGEDALYTCAVVTADAIPGMAHVHPRMPLMLDAAARALWLDRDAPLESVTRLLRPVEAPLDVVRVATLVNNARNDEPRCIEPVAEAERV